MSRQPTRSRITARLRGFTLVELMVVLVIVGLMGVAVVLTAPGDANSLSREADTLAARLVRAQEEAILTTRVVQVVVDAHGYSFHRQSFGEWQPLDEGPFEPIAWAEGTTAMLDGKREQVSFRFEPTGGGREEQVRLTRNDQQLRVGVDAAGEVKVDAPR
ncbi:GspH/FimT family pseudopilin [Lysobacter sp. F6437]|uniref:GspH/FimT family pseudopilin n=1 Tax=Lysobacter sp. F6437 TaxID=3459296 RepID=UPI00403E2E02